MNFLREKRPTAETKKPAEAGFFLQRG